jgi:predicted MFS family arabinose efflux permease
MAEPPQPGNVTDLLKNPELRSLYVAVALISSAWDVHQFVVPLYGASLGLSASSIGFVLGTFAAATFVVRLVLPLVLNRVSEWAMIRLAMVTAVGVYFLYPFFPVLPVMLALSFVLGLGLGVSQPMILSSVHRVAPEGRIGEAVGLRLMLVNASQALLPTAFGAAGGVFGLAPIFWGMSAVISSGVFYTRRAGRPGQPGRPNIDKSDDEGLL